MRTSCWVPHVNALQVVLCATALGLLGMTSVAGQIRGGPTGPPSTTQTPATPGKGLILGRVVDAASGAPVVGAVVTLNSSQRPQQFDDFGLPSAPTTSMSNSDGYFLFRELPGGSYGMTVAAPGYIAGAFGRQQPEGPGRSIVLAEDQRVTDATIKLWKFASLGGTVLDDLGDPAVGVTVRAARRSGGRLSLGIPVQTDDRGAYRIGSLMPGEYLVVVPSSISSVATSVADLLRQPPPASTTLRQTLQANGAGIAALVSPESIRIGGVDVSVAASGPLLRPSIVPQLTADGRLRVAQPAYYPSATTPAAAETVVLTSGQERTNVNIQLRLVATVRVSGVVSGPDGPMPSMAVRLLPGSVEGFSSDANIETATTVSDGSGAFVFPAVPPGEYVVKAVRIPRAANPAAVTVSVGTGVLVTGFGQQPLPAAPTEPTLSAEQRLSIADRDIADLSVRLEPGARLLGTVEFEGGTRPTPAEMPRFGITLAPADDRAIAGPTPAPLDADSRFTTAQYLKGRYFVTASQLPPGWTLTSALVNGQNALEHPFELTNRDIDGVVISLSTRSTDLSGTVRRAGTTGDPNAVVILFPADAQRWIQEGMSARRVRTVAVEPNGSYRAVGLVPSTYSVVAIPADQSADTRNPARIAGLARVATQVTLAAGETKTQALTVALVR